jgi:hypothetical protein
MERRQDFGRVKIIGRKIAKERVFSLYRLSFQRDQSVEQCRIPTLWFSELLARPDELRLDTRFALSVLRSLSRTTAHIEAIEAVGRWRTASEVEKAETRKCYGKHPSSFFCYTCAIPHEPTLKPKAYKRASASPARVSSQQQVNWYSSLKQVSIWLSIFLLSVRFITEPILVERLTAFQDGFRIALAQKNKINLCFRESS